MFGALRARPMRLPESWKSVALEDSRRDQTGDRQREGAATALHDHRPHLAHGRIAERLLDVALHHHHDQPHDGGDETDHERELQDAIGVREDRGEAI